MSTNEPTTEAGRALLIEVNRMVEAIENEAAAPSWRASRRIAELEGALLTIANLDPELSAREWIVRAKYLAQEAALSGAAAGEPDENAVLLRRLDEWQEGVRAGPLIRWAAAHLRGCIKPAPVPSGEGGE